MKTCLLIQSVQLLWIPAIPYCMYSVQCTVVMDTCYTVLYVQCTVCVYSVHLRDYVYVVLGNGKLFTQISSKYCVVETRLSVVLRKPESYTKRSEHIFARLCHKIVETDS